MKKRMLSLLLALTMIVGMLPLSALTVTAASAKHYEVDNWGELSTVLEWDSGSTPVTITLTADIYEETLNVDSRKDEGDEKYDPIPTVQIVGNKTLDLNGYRIEVNDKSNYRIFYAGGIGDAYSKASENTLFNVTADASLTINDATGKGNITFTGHLLSEWADYDHYCVRDIFSVEGTLTLNGGTIEAGRSKKQWFTDEPLDPTGLDYSWTRDEFTICGYEDTHTGYAYQQIWGSAVTMKSNGTFIMNGGTLYGRGSGQYIDDETAREEERSYSDFTTIRDEVIWSAANAKIYINNGNVYAKGGANIFGGTWSSRNLVIKYGTFETDTVDYIRSHEIFPIRITVLGFSANGELITTGTHGVMNVYPADWQKDLDNVVVTVNGTAYTTLEEKQALDLHDVSGTVILAPVAEDGFSLEFVSQNPMMPVGYDTWSLYQEYGKTTTFTFNHIPLTARQVKDGYYVERNYVIRNAANKQVVASGSGILGTDVVNVTHTWNEVGTFTFIEDLTLRDKTGAKVKSKANTFNIYVQPAVDHIEITTPPTQTTYISNIYKNGSYSLPGFYGEGMVVTAYYTDGTTEDVTKYVDFNRTLAIDDTQNAISYTDPVFKEEHFDFQPVTVEKAYQISNTAKGGAAYAGKQMYYATEGTQLDLFNTQHYDTTRYQLDGWTVTRDDNGEAVEVHRHINGGSYYFIMPAATVTIEPIWTLKKVVESIQIQTPPAKTDYYEGQEFNPAGMVLRVFYTDGTWEDIKDEVLKQYLYLDGTNRYLQPTDTAILVRYNGFEVSQPITVSQSQNIYSVEFTMTGYGYGKNVADVDVKIETKHVKFTTVTSTENFSIWRTDITDSSGQVTSGTFGRHEYDISVAVTCDTGYIKAFTKDTVTLNGIKASNVRSAGGGKYLISFLLPSFVVERIDATISDPVADSTIDKVKILVPEDGNYEFLKVKALSMKNGSGYTQVSLSDKLQAGNTYRAMMTFKPTNGCLFVSGTSSFTAKINGDYVTAEYDSATETMTLAYDFTVAAKPTATLVGNITSYRDGHGRVKVELFKQGSATASYSASVTGTVEEPALYVISGIEDGTYTMKVTKANHEVYTATITAAGSMIYKDVVLTLGGDLTVNCIGKINYTVSGQTVTVTNSLACKVGYLSGDKYVAVTPVKNANGSYAFTAPAGVTEVLLVVKGDVSGDGKINVADTSKIYSHVKGTSPITDPIKFFAADVSGDNKLNVADTSKVYAQVKGSAPLTW